MNTWCIYKIEYYIAINMNYFYTLWDEAHKNKADLKSHTKGYIMNNSLT